MRTVSDIRATEPGKYNNIIIRLMKKGLLSLALILAATGMVQAKNDADQVLMTINGKPITLGEFEYLYHKNNSQQLNAQSIDDYLQMFITYKQKVAEAEAEGIDSTQAFQTEFESYRTDLAEPYMTSKEVEDSLVNDVYNRMKEEVDVSHIMMAIRGPQIDPETQKTRLDSIRTAILNGSDFETLARKFSIDRSVVNNGGRMGYISATKFPYTFEEAAYNTPVGEISPVFETPFGYHIVKVNGRRPAQGQVLVEHILKLTQGLPPAEAAAKKAQIDSIATLLANGADFEDLARRESEDPGTKRDGGKLKWFGTGMMVPEFEAASFALKNGETSAPIKTAYGYHIIRKLDSKGVESLATMTPVIKNALAQDERGLMPRRRKLAELQKKYNGTLNTANIDAVCAEIIASSNGLDSIMEAKYIVSDLPVAAIGKKEIPVSEIITAAANMQGIPQQQAEAFKALAARSLDEALLETERQNLAANNPEYRNLLNEYRDGMLLFEISDRNVWTRAKQDKEGLENYFRTHRDKYRWDKPRYKGYVVFATSDSVMNAAKEFLGTHNVASDSLTTTLRKQFGKDIKIEKVIAAQGENEITDYLGFGGPKPESKGKWAYYFPFRDKVLDEPQEAADVRGIVTGDYQNMLEDEWVAKLKGKYPAKVNKKVLKKAK